MATESNDAHPGREVSLDAPRFCAAHSKCSPGIPTGQVSMFTLTTEQFFEGVTRTAGATQVVPRYMFIRFGELSQAAAKGTGFETADGNVVSIGLQESGSVRCVMIEHPDPRRCNLQSFFVDAGVMDQLLQELAVDRVEILFPAITPTAADNSEIFRDCSGRVVTARLTAAGILKRLEFILPSTDG